MSEAERQELRRRIHAAPRDVAAWIRLSTLEGRASGWAGARRVMHEGWVHLRDDPESASRFRELLYAGFELVGDPELSLTNPVSDLCFDADGRRLLIPGADLPAQLLELPGGAPLVSCRGFSLGATVARMDAGAERALVGYSNSRWALFELAEGEPRFRQLQKVPAETDPGRDDLAPDGQRAYLGGRMWRFGRALEGDLRLEMTVGYQQMGGLPLAARFVRAPDRLVQLFADGRVLIRQATTGELEGSLEGGPQGAWPWARRAVACLDRTGRRGAVADTDPETPRLGLLDLTDTARPSRLSRLFSGSGGDFLQLVPLPREEGVPLAVAISDDGQRVALSLSRPRGRTGGRLPSTVRVLDAESGEWCRVFEDLEEPVRRLEFVPGGRRLAVAQRRHVRLLQLE